MPGIFKKSENIKFFKSWAYSIVSKRITDIKIKREVCITGKIVQRTTRSYYLERDLLSSWILQLKANQGHLNQIL